jgi:hypothetical protein
MTSARREAAATAPADLAERNFPMDKIRAIDTLDDVKVLVGAILCIADKDEDYGLAEIHAVALIVHDKLEEVKRLIRGYRAGQFDNEIADCVQD